MSGMADEMARRIAADEAAGAADGNAGVAPGNDGRQVTPTPPPAGESNADMGDRSGPPDTIPYARFKEVNDSYSRLKGYEELEQYGYDADSLRRLANFEAGYLQDPIGTLEAMAANLDLPQHLVDAITAHKQSLVDGSGRAEGEPAGDGGGEAKLPPDVQKRLEYVDRLQAREQEAAQEAQLQAVVRAWEQLDEEERLGTNERPSERLKLMAISAVAGSGQQFRTYEDLAKAAREEILGYRSGVLGAAVQGTGRGGAPPALPSSAPASSGPVKFGSFREASRAAEEAIKRGELPAIQP